MKTTFENIIVAFVLILGITGCSHTSNRKAISDESYLNKVQGEWLGKCIGGALGMPIEGWNQDEIENKYGKITSYIGYFNEVTKSSSKVLSEVAYNTDGQWHAVSVKMKVPDYNLKEQHAVPVIWITGASADTNKCELRNFKMIRSTDIPDFSPIKWRSWVAKVSDDGIVHFKYPKENISIANIKPLGDVTAKVCLKPGEEVTISLDARYISGPDKIGLSVDFMDNKVQVGFGPDDDTSMQLCFLSSFEKNGPDLSCRQIGKTWVEMFCPNGWGDQEEPYLAEGIAIKKMSEGIMPPQSGIHAHSDAIGGQMKAEICGLICPGKPELAAEYARRDGVVAHAGEGVYGEQYIASMISASFFENEIETLMKTALKYIPENSEYAKCVQKCILAYHKYPNYQDAFKELIYLKETGRIFEYYNDAVIVNLSLLYGKGDFEKSILMAAKYGQDTDCDCASVGAMVGCIIGADAIPGLWKEPINDQFYSWIKGFENIKISDLSARICKAGRSCMKFHENGMNFSSQL